MTQAFEARGLQVALGGREVLHGIDLVLPAGRWTALVGPNGAGKTTLLKTLAHLLPFRGELAMLGKPSGAWSARERARAVSWLGQGEPGAEDLRAADVVMLGRLPHQAWLATPSAADAIAVERAMRQTQCWDWRARPLGQLSGGERQRVLLARALAVEAPVLLMDEPLANLDPPHQADWLALVRAQVAQGRTVLSVLHELTKALHADDLLVLQAGRLVHHGRCDDPATHQALRHVFDHRIRVQALEGQWVALPHV